MPKQPKVLVCDDRQDNYERIRASLEAQGFKCSPRVETAQELRQQLAQARDSRAWFHAVMIDLDLSESGERPGTDVYLSLLPEFPHEGYIIYSSAYIDGFKQALNRLQHRHVPIVLLDELVKEGSIYRYFASFLQSADKSTVFLIHGRHSDRNKKMRALLADFGLTIVTLEDAERYVSNARKYVFDVVMQGIEMSHATVALFTDEEEVELLKKFCRQRDSDTTRKQQGRKRRRQSRANVFIEAGFAFGVRPHRTVFVEWPTRGSDFSLPSDLEGVFTIRFDNSEQERSRLRRKLEDARCVLKSKRR